MLQEKIREPLLNAIDISKESSLDPLVDDLENHGYARFSGMTDAQQLLGLASNFGSVRIHHMTDERGVTTLRNAPQINDARGTFRTDTELQPHVDGAAMENPSGLILMYCPQPDEAGGGISTVADGKDVYETLASKDPALLELMQQPLGRLMRATLLEQFLTEMKKLG